MSNPAYMSDKELLLRIADLLQEILEVLVVTSDSYSEEDKMAFVRACYPETDLEEKEDAGTSTSHKDKPPERGQSADEH